MYVPFHIFIIPLFLPRLAEMAAVYGLRLTTVQLNFIYYITGFVFLGLTQMRYLRESFGDFCDSVGQSLWRTLRNFIWYYAMAYVVNFVLLFFITDLVNPNTNAVVTEAQVNRGGIFVVSVLLAPIVEEILFRETIFGTIRTKSVIGAYVVSTLIFSVYHLWQYFVIGYDVGQLLLYMLQYLPGSIMLAKTYEDTGNIWSPIIMHMAINGIALSASTML